MEICKEETSGDEHQRFFTICQMDFGTDFPVTAAQDKGFDNVVVCIISIWKDHSVKEWVRTELAIRCQLYHPHVLKFYDVFLSENEIHVTFEHPKGNNLLTTLTTLTHKMDERYVRHLFQQLVFAVEYFHLMGVEGIDLVLENVYYERNSGILKTVDFGLKRSEGSEQTYSLPYIAPEQLSSRMNSHRPHKEADVWRLGVILYCMLFQRFPFCPTRQTTTEEHILNVMRVKWSIPEGETLSTECKDLLRQIFTPRPNDRITVRGIKSHPWYQENLPEGVMDYEIIERPSDGLLQKVANIKEIICV